MSFNTSNLSADTIKADIHYVEDLAISKNQSGNLVLNAPIVEAVVVQSSSVIADSGVFSFGLNPLEGGDGNIYIGGNLDLNGGSGLKNISTLTIENVPAVAGYVLSSTDTSGTLAWIPDATSSTPSLSSVLNVGNTASQNINMDNNSITSANSVSATSVNGNIVKANSLDTNNPSQTQINVLKNLNLSANILYAREINAGNTITALTTRFGVEPNRWTGFDSYTLSQLDNDNRVVSESGADLIGFHNVESLRGKFYTTDVNGDEKFSATDAGAIVSESLSTKQMTIPTLTPSVGQVLASSDTSGTLYWKNDASGDVSQWSAYPAVQIVDMNNNTVDNAFSVYTKNLYSINNLENGNIYSNNLTIQDGAGTPQLTITPNGCATVGSIINNGFLKDATLSSGSSGQLLSSTGTATAWVDAPIPSDVSQWATYPANNNVNFAGYTITGTKDKGAGIDVGTKFLMNNNNIEGVNDVNCVKVSANTASIDVIQNVVSIESSQATGLEILTKINMNNLDITNTKDIYCNKVLSTYQLQNTYYVSPNGSDTTGTGAINNPYQTIQKGIDVASVLTVSDNVYRYVLVQAGSYNESLTITTKINLIGMGNSSYESSVGCSINGSININVGQNGADMFNNCVNISGFLIGSLVSFISTENSILNIENCYLYSDDNTSGRALYFNPSSVNSRLRITNTIINSGGSVGLDPLVEITKSSSLTINNVILNAKGLQNVLCFSGTATCDTINNCKIENSVVSDVAPALVRINSTNSGTYTFTNCGFIYSDTTDKSSSPSSSGILCDSASGNPRVVILYCSFFLFGTTTANYAVQDLNYGTATAMGCLYYMNNASLNNAFSIRAILNTNKFQLQIVS
jgi:hypothetical protein